MLTICVGRFSKANGWSEQKRNAVYHRRIKKQIGSRLSLPHVHDVLAQLCARAISVEQACASLVVGKTRLNAHITALREHRNTHERHRELGMTPQTACDKPMVRLQGDTQTITQTSEPLGGRYSARESYVLRGGVAFRYGRCHSYPVISFQMTSSCPCWAHEGHAASLFVVAHRRDSGFEDASESAQMVRPLDATGSICKAHTVRDVAPRLPAPAPLHGRWTGRTWPATIRRQ